jgi:peptidoglycan L-alanyl-D-glutamate endopeptidase CwlK
MTYKLGTTSMLRLKGVKPLLRKVVERAIQISSVDFLVAEGLRSAARQKELYAQGRTSPGKKVTWTMDSKHLTGDAVDLVPFVNGKADWNDLKKFDEIYKAMMQAAEELGGKLRYGGDWDRDGILREKGETDSPHFELFN